MKQALKSSGAHCTMKHMEEISMSGLLLLDTAKAADSEFHTPYRSSHHVIGSVENDIVKMTAHLLEEKVTNECEGRVSMKFDEPIALGMQKIVDGWLKEYLKSSCTSETIEDDDEQTRSAEDLDIDYELYFTTF